MNIHRDERLRDFVGRQPTLAQTALASTAFLALSAALLLLCMRTHLGSAQVSEAMLVWTAAFAFVGSLSASGLVWAVTVNVPEAGHDYVALRRGSNLGASPCSAVTARRHPASLSVLIDILDAHCEHRTQAG